MLHDPAHDYRSTFSLWHPVPCRRYLHIQRSELHLALHSSVHHVDSLGVHCLLERTYPDVLVCCTLNRPTTARLFHLGILDLAGGIYIYRDQNFTLLFLDQCITWIVWAFTTCFTLCHPASDTSGWRSWGWS